MFLAAGCGMATTPSNDAAMGTDSPSFTDARVDDSGVGPCAYVDTLDRTCASDADCAVGLHQTNCCGSSVMIGLRSTQQSTYASSESACMASYPACGCPATLPTTDSGETVTDTGAVLAACVSVGPTMVCRTYVTMRPPNGR